MHFFEFGSSTTLVRVKCHIAQGHIRIPSKGRWAHNNVKLLHSLSMQCFHRRNYLSDDDAFQQTISDVFMDLEQTTVKVTLLYCIAMYILTVSQAVYLVGALRFRCRRLFPEFFIFQRQMVCLMWES